MSRRSIVRGLQRSSGGLEACARDLGAGAPAYGFMPTTCANCRMVERRSIPPTGWRFAGRAIVKRLHASVQKGWRRSINNGPTWCSKHQAGPDHQRLWRAVMATNNVCAVEGCDNSAEKRGWCDKHYQRFWKNGDPTKTKRTVNDGRCAVDGCSCLPRSPTASHCEKHYMRFRRRGSLDLAGASAVLFHTGGYRLVHSPGHPLCTSDRVHVYGHRKVFYDKHGAGPFRCHVCTAEIGWGVMHVDHLNDVKDDNRIENLAPACPTCNQGRGAWKMKATHRAKAAQ